MYFPYIRGKQYDLAAVAELSEKIATSGKICPIVEPVNVNTATQNKISLFAEKGMPFLLIMNPQVGDLTHSHSQVKQILFDQYLAECETCIPAFIFNSHTTILNLREFVEEYPLHEIAVIYDMEPTDKNLVDVLVGNSNILFHVFFDYRAKREIRELVPLERRVIIEDSFEKQDKNANYPPESYFSDRYLKIPDNDYNHFGDFSVVGRLFSDSGGPAYAVTLHHIYANPSKENSLWVKHFISDRTNSPSDTGGKFLEALSKLIAELPNLGEQNETPVCADYEALYAASHYPGLGVAKKLALKHHFCLMLKFFSEVS